MNNNNRHTDVASELLSSRMTNKSSHHTTSIAKTVFHLAVMKRNVMGEVVIQVREREVSLSGYIFLQKNIMLWIAPILTNILILIM